MNDLFEDLNAAKAGEVAAAVRWLPLVYLSRLSRSNWTKASSERISTKNTFLNISHTNQYTTGELR